MTGPPVGTGNQKGKEYVIYSIYSEYIERGEMAQKIGNIVGIFAITTLPVLMGVAIYFTIVFGG